MADPESYVFLGAFVEIELAGSGIRQNRFGIEGNSMLVACLLLTGPGGPCPGVSVKDKGIG